MYQHPGVYIEHVPSGALSIEAASTSVAAFIGPVKRGDLVTADKDKGKPVFISSIGQFTRLFGELRGGNGGIRDFGANADAFGFAVNAFFNNGGSKAYIVPVGKGDGKEAIAAFANPLAPANGFYFNAKSEGAWANGMVAELTLDAAVPNATTPDFTKSTFKLAFGLLDSNGKLNPVLESFTGLSVDQTSPLFLVDKVNAGSELVEAAYAVIGSSSSAGLTQALLGKPVATVALGASDAITVMVDALTAVNVPLAGFTTLQSVAGAIMAKVQIAAPANIGYQNFIAQVTLNNELLLISGSSGSGSKVIVLGGDTAVKLGLDPTYFIGTIPPNAFTPADLKKIGISLGGGTATTVDLSGLPNVQLATIANKITAGMIGAEPKFVATVVDTNKLALYVKDGDALKAVTVTLPTNPLDDCKSVIGLDNPNGTKSRPDPLSYPSAYDSLKNVERATFAGGFDHTAPDKQAYLDAYDRLRDYRDISIMLLPGQIWIKGGDNSIIEAAVTHAEFMQNRMVIVDPPEPVGIAKLESPTDVNALGLTNSPYTALYYPWLGMVNPFYDKDTAPGKPKTFSIPPSATGAGMWARIDAARGVWKAPAGLEASVRGTLGPTVLIGNDLQDNLNEWGVNCLRAIIGPTVIWGARTLATKSKPEFRYIPVRRTQSMIGESLYNALQAVVFEPNDHKLWASLRASVGTFMDGLHRSGAFQGEKASDAYYVHCGLGSTMTQGDIDAGIVRVVVGFAPLKPAEFVVVQIQQIVGQTA